MKHLSHISGFNIELPDTFMVKATGRYYTHDFVAEHMMQAALRVLKARPYSRPRLSIIDPFAGDGRLILRFIETWLDAELPDVTWEVILWDLNTKGLEVARRLLAELALRRGIKIEPEFIAGDAFHFTSDCNRKFDVVVSNPPWELLKPDRREIKQLEDEVQISYVAAMRDYDCFLAEKFPCSQPSRKFAGWGTNLSRVGYDACRTLVSADGLISIVMPASFMADDLSVELRRQIIQHSTLHDIAYFPAEARLFDSADVAAITLVVEPRRVNGVVPKFTRFSRDLHVVCEGVMELSDSFLESGGFVIPMLVGGDAIAVLERLSRDFSTWKELEGKGPTSLWAGRELDETGRRQWLKSMGHGPLFVKGRMVDRFMLCEAPTEHVEKPGWSPTPSMQFHRIVWRDVSRPNQKRRIIATLIPPGLAAGNSLGVAHFRDGDEVALRTLLGLMSSLVFEFQLRSHLATGHISLSSLRKVRVPSVVDLESMHEIAAEVEALISSPGGSQTRLEVLVASRAYGLSSNEFKAVVETFPKLTAAERSELLDTFKSLREPAPIKTIATLAKRIPNHFTARLSALDLQMVWAVPSGGNWKDIPESIPSKRLEQIRESFKRGEGSRSTYYGRLRAGMPSYTISTYFNRPGNGCHIHYAQDRVLSQREAARLQSFPDSFKFVGPQGSVNKQIGNAVPPLLAYQIALQLGEPGCFIDLFSGAGGLSLGFIWAGWTPVVANDIEERFLQTYAKNIHDSVILGSISNDATRAKVIERAQAARAKVGGKPLWVLGGPPCQGFSTAGHRRSMEGDRNYLFLDYVKVLADLQPEGFLFENVTGLLNMQNGRVFQMIKEAFRSVMPRVDGWLLSADEYAIPQRRKRVILVGTRDENHIIRQPPKITSCELVSNLFAAPEPAISVEESLADLPALEPGQDGSTLPYGSPPRTTYQSFMRGQLSPSEYLETVRERRRNLK